MLKRYQVLLYDWQGDYYKELAKVNGISFSEAIRIACACLILDKVKPIKSAQGKIKTKEIIDVVMFEARKEAEAEGTKKK